MSKEILKQAYEAWNAAAAMRRRRARCKRYTYGDQWSDSVVDSSGRVRLESEVLAEGGNRPLINNLIRQLVKTIVGRYRTVAADNGVYDDIADLARRNNLAELDARMLEEFLISGCAVQRVVADERFGSRRVWVDNIDFRRFFANRFTDPRGWDINLVGMLHDFTFPELAARFAGGKLKKAEALRELYGGRAEPVAASASIGGAASDVAFFAPSDPSRCRVTEVWTLDARSFACGDDIDFRFCWHCRWLAPDGSVLSEYDSPYPHGTHPFVVKFYPLTDGEVHSFVEDIIDQQRSINRAIVLIDKIMSTTAKGVLLFPRDQMVENMSWDEICRRWAQSDGVIPISGRGEHLPQQVLTNPSASGAYELLQMQMKLFDDIAGVGDSLMGRGSTSARGAEMFESQVKNATIALADIFETFATFTAMRNKKALATA